MALDKLAVFQVVNNGVDGRGKTMIDFSSLSEEERDNYYKGLGKSNIYHEKRDVVLSMSELGRSFVERLNANDLMVMRHCFDFDKFTDSLVIPIGEYNYTFWDVKKEVN